MTRMKEWEKRAKAKAKKITIILSVLTFICFFVMLGIPKSTLDIVVNSSVFFLWGLICYCAYKIFVIICYSEEEGKESKKFAESVLTSKIQTEVVPIEGRKSEFITDLTNIAKFYAIINEKDEIQISVKFNNENELRKLETITKELFKNQYQLPSKKKIRK